MWVTPALGSQAEATGAHPSLESQHCLLFAGGLSQVARSGASISKTGKLTPMWLLCRGQGVGRGAGEPGLTPCEQRPPRPALRASSKSGWGSWWAALPSLEAGGVKRGERRKSFQLVLAGSLQTPQVSRSDTTVPRPWQALPSPRDWAEPETRTTKRGSRWLLVHKTLTPANERTRFWVGQGALGNKESH